MRTRKLLVAAGVGILTLGIALPASADSGATTVTFVVTPGVLAITVPAAALLTPRVNSTTSGTNSGALGVLTVSDLRTGSAGWTTTVVSSTFTGTGLPVIPASAVSYSAGTITKVVDNVGAVYTPFSASGLATAVNAVTATSITGENVVTWNPTINVAAPGGTTAGTYIGTITHSVS